MLSGTTWFTRRTLHQTLLLGSFTLLTACNDAPTTPNAASHPLVIEGKTMGTFYRVSLAGVDPQEEASLREAITAQLAKDDGEISTYKPHSVLSRFNQYTGNEPQPVSADMADLVVCALRIGALTKGAMDITVGPLVNLWGFGPEKQPVKEPEQQQIDQAKAQTGLQHLTVIHKAEGQWLQKDLPGLYVDLSTVGEGYATDNLARLMERRGIRNYLVSVGGAVVSRGYNDQGKPWRVAIQKPTDQENAVQAIVDLQGHGISTSGSYRNYYEVEGKRFSHIIDPATGRPITHKLVSATVISPTATEADGWDTGLMVLGTEKALALAKQHGLAVYLITKEGDRFKTYMSPQFQAFIVNL